MMNVVQNEVKKMRQDWDERARENAQYFVCTDVPLDKETFLASGREDYRLHVQEFLERVQFSPTGKTALEIGCGLGRMTRCFAGDFQSVIAVDISGDMIARASAEGIPCTQFFVGSGLDLRSVQASSVDLVFSYIVFQHISRLEVILKYFEEIGRVLRQGGRFRIHTNGLPHVEIGPLLLEGYISKSPKLRPLGLKSLPFVRRRRLSSWLGHPVSTAELRKVCGANGLRIEEVTGRWTEQQWVSGRKIAS